MTCGGGECLWLIIEWVKMVKIRFEVNGTQMSILVRSLIEGHDVDCGCIVHECSRVLWPLAK